MDDTTPTFLLAFARTGTLTSRGLIELAVLGKHQVMEGADEMRAAQRRVEGAIGGVTDAVWIPWLRSYYRAAKVRGHESVAQGLSMMVWGCAGRVLVTLRRADERRSQGQYVSLIGSDGVNESLYIQGLHGSPIHLVSLLQNAARASSALRRHIRPEDVILDAAAGETSKP